MRLHLFRSPHNAPLALALQGGGAHGAFTWGVLDALLEQRANPIVAVSGASAGAMNALLLAHGLLEGGREGARAALAAFWNALGQSVPWDAWGLVTGDGVQFTAPAQWMLRWVQAVSPAQANPMRMNPLRDLLAKSVDFERLRRQSRIALHIAATHANSGRLRVFDNANLSLDAAMASACLPSLHHAVEIDGGEHLASLPSSSKLITHSALLQRLHDAGRDRALQWLQAHAQHIGRRSTLDLIGAFGSHHPPAV